MHQNPSKRTSVPSRNRQRGLSIIGMVIGIALIGVVGLTAAKAAPAWIEYSAIKSIIHKIKSEGPADIASIKRDFSKQAQIDGVTTINENDLVIDKDGDNYTISFSYEASVPLIGNASLVFEFEGEE